jgi:alkylation response protein AidB-like acyl-CoA dehydrogenase
VLDYSEPDGVARLRTRLRELVRDLVPPSFLGAFTSDPDDFALAERFCRELGRQQLLTMAWPEQYGGAGADIWEQTALREEMWAAHEPRGAQYMGLNWVGPTIMRYGTDDQKERHLPRIAAGEVVWCQGFSEPGAGSDLPSLRTRATKVDGGWSISGQKVWTSYARMAQSCFLLARTGEPGGDRDGITVFLLDMAASGIEVRPIKAMLGEHHLNEVYLDDVFVPDAEVLGEIGRGWDIVREVLRFERIGIARYARCEKLLREAPHAVGPERWAALPAAVRDRWSAALVHARQARLLAYRTLEQAESGLPDRADGALYRIAVTELDQETAEVLMAIVGDAGLGTPDRSRVYDREVEDHWRYSQAATVASGTLEMQKQTVTRSLVPA